MSNVPYTIKTIFDQMNISFMRVGGSKLGYNMQNPNYTEDELRNYSCYPEKESSVRHDGQVLQDVGLYFRVNTTRKIYIYVSYEPDDTYTVRMWQANSPNQFVKTGKVGEVISERFSVYCDMLGDVIERMYDKYINEHQHGFIHIK